MGFETQLDHLISNIGREWLQGREDKPEWAFVWQHLVELVFDTDALVTIGREWLQGRENRAEYPYVLRLVQNVRPT